MKTIASFAIATVMLSAATATQARDFYCGTRIIVQPSTPHFCAPYLVCTKEVCRRVEWRYVYDNCGHLLTVPYMVVTYADFFSDGSSRSYTRTYRA